jgi:hypothetical protein
MAESYLDQSQIFGLLIKFYGECMPEGMEFFRYGPIKLPDLIKAIVTDAKEMSTVLLTGEFMETMKELGMKGDFSVIRVL